MAENKDSGQKRVRRKENLKLEDFADLVPISQGGKKFVTPLTPEGNRNVSHMVGNKMRLVLDKVLSEWLKADELNIPPQALKDFAKALSDTNDICYRAMGDESGEKLPETSKKTLGLMSGLLDQKKLIKKGMGEITTYDAIEEKMGQIEVMETEADEIISQTILDDEPDA